MSSNDGASSFFFFLSFSRDLRFSGTGAGAAMLIVTLLQETGEGCFLDRRQIYCDALFMSKLCWNPRLIQYFVAAFVASETAQSRRLELSASEGEIKRGARSMSTGSEDNDLGMKRSTSAGFTEASATSGARYRTCKLPYTAVLAKETLVFDCRLST